MAGLVPVGVTITRGDAVHGGHGGVNVPKLDRVDSVVVAFQRGQLVIAAALSYAEILREELMHFEVKINPITAHGGYNAREGYGTPDPATGVVEDFFTTTSPAGRYSRCMFLHRLAITLGHHEAREQVLRLRC